MVNLPKTEKFLIIYTKKKHLICYFQSTTYCANTEKSNNKFVVFPKRKKEARAVASRKPLRALSFHGFSAVF